MVVDSFSGQSSLFSAAFFMFLICFCTFFERSSILTSMYFLKTKNEKIFQQGGSFFFSQVFF